MDRPGQRRDGKPWDWPGIHKVAALAGVENIEAFTLRELVWRTEALQLDAWDRAAWISMHCVMPHAGRKRVRLEDVHPLRHKPEPQPITRAWRDEMIRQGVLRKERTPEEKESAWREFCRRVDARES